jgi:methylthioribose-1-phosphate isomerase
MENPSKADPRTVAWVDDTVALIDQKALPQVQRSIRCRTVERVADAIADLEVRGAPAIGVAAAMGVALAAHTSTASELPVLLAELHAAADMLRATRPTAVNLAWAVDQVLSAAVAADGVDGVRSATLERAQTLADDDVDRCHAIGANGGPLLSHASNVITHCNAGALATVEYGTALGVIRAAHDRHPDLHVWVDETRPVLQGARLTSYELTRDGVANTLIADGAAASVIARGDVDAAVVGADRIAANGDVANKIGTYALALACHYHEIPFYVAAPLSTVDLDTPDGRSIPIEERSPDEITRVGDTHLTLPGQSVHNPAFDVTPAGLVTAVITEAGVLRAPYRTSLAQAFA